MVRNKRAGWSLYSALIKAITKRNVRYILQWLNKKAAPNNDPLEILEIIRSELKKDVTNIFQPYLDKKTDNNARNYETIGWEQKVEDKHYLIVVVSAPCEESLHVVVEETLAYVALELKKRELKGAFPVVIVVFSRKGIRMVFYD